jgi:hypothetical protein
MPVQIADSSDRHEQVQRMIRERGKPVSDVEVPCRVAQRVNDNDLNPDFTRHSDASPERVGKQ